MLQRPNAEPFASDADREAWRAHILVEWWQRVVHARASAEIAGSILPHLTTKKLAPWTSDFLTIVWINSLDRVVLTDIDLLSNKKDRHSFKGLTADLQRWCHPRAWPSWSMYLDAVVDRARTSGTFHKAELARNRLIAHSDKNPLRGKTGFQDLRLTTKEILKLQDLTEEIFASFPDGDTLGFRPVVASRYPDLVERVVRGDVAGLAGEPAQIHLGEARLVIETED